MNKKGFINILLVVVVVGLVGAGIYIVSTRQISPPVPTPSPSPTPTRTQNGEKIIRRVGEQESSYFIQKINSDSVEGLWYQPHPVGKGEGEPRTLHIGDDIGHACEGVSEKLISIDFSGQTITFNKIVGQPPEGGCPVCLAENTLIDTPYGLIAVQNLQEGREVWTLDSFGLRIPAKIVKAIRTPVPADHRVIHLILNDGRELFVSPGHPTGDGRIMGELSVGDVFDGVDVLIAQSIPYQKDFTYDILPSGETGLYWANGIIVGSTLSY